jgi:predicted transcriptional regulator
MATANVPTPKQQAHQLIDELPDSVSWEELAYRMEVRADIEAGLADAKAGRVITTVDLRREFGLPDE